MLDRTWVVVWSGACWEAAGGGRAEVGLLWPAAAQHRPMAQLFPSSPPPFCRVVVEWSVLSPPVSPPSLMCTRVLSLISLVDFSFLSLIGLWFTKLLVWSLPSLLEWQLLGEFGICCWLCCLFP